MKFEYDQKKSMTNKSTHGLTLEEAKAADFDASFEKGDVTEHLDLSSAKVRYPVQRISIDFSKTILEGLDIPKAFRN